ncbi:MAG: hypothetical protein ACE5HQ_10135 [Gemmatimonadota bacterium]
MSSSPDPSVHFGGGRCAACGSLQPEGSLDEERWCPRCRARLRRLARLAPHLVAAVLAVPFGLWILSLEKTSFLPFYAWLLPLAAAYYLGFRIGRELIKGYARWRRTR